MIQMSRSSGVPGLGSPIFTPKVPSYHGHLDWRGEGALPRISLITVLDFSIAQVQPQEKDSELLLIPELQEHLEKAPRDAQGENVGAGVGLDDP